MKNKILNEKGLSHNLLLILVATVAVVGAAGYMVWQRQKNNDIDAKAAGYGDVAPDSRYAPNAKKHIQMGACKNKSISSPNYYMLSFYGKRINTGVSSFNVTYFDSTTKKNISKDAFFYGTPYAYIRGTNAIKAYKDDFVSLTYVLDGRGYDYRPGLKVSSIPFC